MSDMVQKYFTILCHFIVVTIIPILQMSKLELERLHNLYKVTQLLSGKIGIWTKETYIQYVTLPPNTKSTQEWVTDCSTLA